MPLWFRMNESVFGLDFYLPSLELYIEVKQFHSPRIADQMRRADSVIAIQGIAAARFFARYLLTGVHDA